MYCNGIKINPILHRRETERRGARGHRNKLKRTPYVPDIITHSTSSRYK